MEKQWPGIACPICGSFEHIVTNTRNRELSRYRRRECLKCGERFSTTERLHTKKTRQDDAVWGWLKSIPIGKRGTINDLIKLTAKASNPETTHHDR